MSVEDNTLLAKWLNQSITPEELEQLKATHDLDRLKAILDQQEAFDLDMPATDELWNQFEQKKLATSEAQPESEVSAPRRQANRKKLLLVLLGILILGVLGTFLYQYFNAPQKIHTQPGEQKTQQLADGTTIELSPGTNIVYFEKNWDKERKLKLQGQAFFEVSKGNPFSVQTEVGLVEVLGTAFDIWSQQDYMRVQCFEGKVSVKHISTGQTEELQAGQQLRLNKKAIEAVELFDEKHPDWKEKRQQIYKRIPANLVLKDIERFHNITINTSGLDQAALFSGLIPLNSVEASARYLAEGMGWKYAIDQDAVSFTR